MKTNIFICHNPFHNYFCTQLCLTLFRSAEYRNIIVTSAPIARVSGIEYLFIDNGIISRFVGYWKGRQLLNKYARVDGVNVEIFMPHIDGVLSNYVFHSKLIQRCGSKISFYYEGTVMVDQRRAERTWERFVIKKRALGAVILHWFINHPDILPLRSDKIYKVYTPYPPRTDADPAKIVPVSFQRENIRPEKGGALIVGVDGQVGLHEVTKSLVHYVKTNPAIKSVFFKPHYADTTKAFENEAMASGLDYKMVESKQCIEEIIGNLPVEMVLCTYFSSALLNLKLIYKDELNVLFLARPEALHEIGPEHIDLLNTVGVKIINLD